MVIQKYITGILAAGLITASLGAYIKHKQVQVLQAQNKTVQADLVASSAALASYQKDAKARARVDAAQTAYRNAAAEDLKALQAALKKERDEDSTPRSIASPNELARLRRLAEAGNESIRTARELP